MYLRTNYEDEIKKEKKLFQKGSLRKRNLLKKGGRQFKKKWWKTKHTSEDKKLNMIRYNI